MSRWTIRWATHSPFPRTPSLSVYPFSLCSFPFYSRHGALIPNTILPQLLPWLYFLALLLSGTTTFWHCLQNQDIPRKAQHQSQSQSYQGQCPGKENFKHNFINPLLIVSTSQQWPHCLLPDVCGTGHDSSQLHWTRPVLFVFYVNQCYSWIISVNKFHHCLLLYWHTSILQLLCVSCCTRLHNFLWCKEWWFII